MTDKRTSRESVPSPLTTPLAAMPGVVALRVEATVPPLRIGLHAGLRATAAFSDLTSDDFTDRAEWSSSDPTIATVGNDPATSGVVSAIRPGKVTITAVVRPGMGISLPRGLVSDKTAVTVLPPTPSDIAIVPNDAALLAGTMRRFGARGQLDSGETRDITDEVVWSSDNPAVITVSMESGHRGEATAAAPGSATIRATLNAIAKSTTVKVLARAIDLVSIAVAPDRATISVNGGPVWLAARGTFRDGHTENISELVDWSSSVPSVAAISIDPGGRALVTGLQLGSAVITARAANGAVAGTASITVAPAFLQSILVSPVAPVMPANTTQQLVATGVYDDRSTRDLTADISWSSSADGAATVSNAPGAQGLVTAIAGGVANIIAMGPNGIVGKTDVAVTTSPAESLAMAPSNASIPLHLTRNFHVFATRSDGARVDLTKDVVWSSANERIVTIASGATDAGVATGRAVGVTSVSAVLPGTELSARTSVRVAGAELLMALTADVLLRGPTVVATYLIDADTGGLEYRQRFEIPGRARGIKISTNRNARIACIARPDPGAVYSFVIGPDARMTPSSGSPYPTPGGGPGSGIAAAGFDRSGRYYYVQNGDQSVVGYAVNQETGALTLIPGSPFPAAQQGVFAEGIEFSNSGQFLFAVSARELNGKASLTTFAIDAHSGALTKVASREDPNNYRWVMHPSLPFAYAINFHASTIQPYGIGVAGDVSPTAQRPLPLGANPWGLTAMFDPTGRYLYVMYGREKRITVFEMNRATGGLTPVTGSRFPVVAPGRADTAAMSESGEFLYVSNYSVGSEPQQGLLHAYRMDPAAPAIVGLLKASPFPLPMPYPLSLVIAPVAR